MIETINKLIRTSRQLVQELGREPTSEEIAKRMDVRWRNPQSAEDCAGADLARNADWRRGRFAPGRLHRGPRGGFSSEAVINVNLKDQTSQVLRTLTPREEKVIKMRFGLEDGSESTLEEGAILLGFVRLAHNSVTTPTAEELASAYRRTP